MRNLLIVAVVAAAAWSGYWLFGSRALESAALDWLEERRTEGWVVDYSAISVRGFPNRFDLTVEDLELADPDTGVSWRAPFFQLFALSYKPNHVIAIWPGTQIFATPFQRIEMTAGEMQASIVTKPGPSLELDRSNLAMSDVSLVSNAGWNTTLAHMTAAIRETDTAQSYDIAAEISAFTPSDDLRETLDRGGKLPADIEAVRLDSTVGFAAPLDRRTIEEQRPDITDITLREARGTWGELMLRGTGAVDVDPTGVLTGAVTVNARNWREMLDMAEAADAIPSDMRGAIELGLQLIAGLSGNASSIDATLDLRGGRAFLGPIPLGHAPRLNLR